MCETTAAVVVETGVETAAIEWLVSVGQTGTAVQDTVSLVHQTEVLTVRRPVSAETHRTRRLRHTSHIISPSSAAAGQTISSDNPTDGRPVTARPRSY